MTDEGQRFDEAARPDERTVQKVARGEHKAPRKRRKPRKVTATVTTSLKVDPEVWRTALGLAASPKHIEIRSETVVVVHNQPPPWPRP